MSLAPGVLSVTVEFAKDIKNRAWIGRQDPYCILRVGNQTFRTRTAVDGGRNPVWDETFEFNVENENDLEIDIMDDEVGRDEPLGSTSCTLAQVRLAGTDRMELPVISRHHEHQHGIVGVSLRWTPTGPSRGMAGYGYIEPGTVVGGAAYSGMVQAPPLPPYGVDPLQVVEVVQEGEYPHHHHHHHHHHQQGSVEEVVVIERTEEGW
ncbi:hypothetical protein Vretimale_16202 [Volvox reticuliferus]|uniref:Uncharacterized protein n=1 Tax=Volvox reticuliferus TaxID=1737510 RepID=A0A8J4D091_9CHLO|nr:hypothetical protein Vretifemale_16960 [Volvox reticuliferus]GIM13001.1 hypothetical protein Vretimale_16202 [Volvox reticuliferus]